MELWNDKYCKSTITLLPITTVIITITYYFYPRPSIQCTCVQCITELGSGGRAVERRTVNRGDSGSIPPTAVSKLRQFRSPHICLCLSEETLKAGGPFYLVSMPGEVKDLTQGVNV